MMTTWDLALEAVKNNYRENNADALPLFAKADGSIWDSKRRVTKLVTQSLATHYLRSNGFVDTRHGWIPKEHLEAKKTEAA